MHKYTNKQKGYTLVEMVVVLAIMALIAVLVGNYIATSFKSTTYAEEQQTAIVNARRAIEIMSKEIRGANNSEQGDYPLGLIENDELIYYTDVDYNGKAERVHYYLSSSTLMKAVTEPGPSNDYSEIPATSTIVHYVSNEEESLFSYFDSELNETSDIDDIRLIRIFIMINVTPERKPNDYPLQTDINLRNLKDNL